MKPITVALSLSFILLTCVINHAARAITGEDYQHGFEQVHLMLNDRPAMSKLLINSDPLLIWTAAQFAGAQTEFIIYWDNTVPPDGVEAQHQSLTPNENGQSARILVHPVYQTGSEKGQQKTAHNLWADLIFELHNISKSQAFKHAYDEAIQGKLGYQGWLRKLTEAEHNALKETAEFYRLKWRIWMRARKMNPISSHWLGILDVPDHYMDWISRYRNLNEYPYSPYGEYYQNQILPYLLSRNLKHRYDPFSLPTLPPLADEQIGSEHQ